MVMRRLLPLSLAIFGAPIFAQADTTSPVRDPGERLQREWQERERERALERAPGSLAIPMEVEDTWGDSPERLPEDGPTFLIREVVWQGEWPLPARKFKQVTEAFIGKPLGIRRINLLLDRLNRFLVESGYITSRAYIGSQNLGSGVLSITVVPGHIESIRYNGEPVPRAGWNRPGLRLALPMREGDILRLPDIEQAVDQLNRLRRNRVQVQLKPGDSAGGTLIDFVNTPDKAAQYRVTADNQGSPGTGKLRIQVGAETGDLLGLMESFSVGLTSSLETNAVYAAASLPIGYSTLSMMTSWSEYQNLIGDTALVYGTSESVTAAWNYLIHRDRTSKTALDASLIRRNAKRMVNNARLTPQTNASARVGINRLTRFETQRGTGQWTVDIGLVRGLDAFNADRDPADLPPEAARGQFDKLEVSASLALPLADGYAWRARANGQWSRHALYSSEQMFLGGVASVRGFAESALGGDRGLQLRTELVKENLAPVWGGRFRLEPYLFLDAGQVETVADATRQSIAGLGAGLRIGHARGQAELIAGWPIKRADGLEGQGPRFNISLSYRF